MLLSISKRENFADKKHLQMKSCEIITVVKSGILQKRRDLTLGPLALMSA